MIEGSLSFKGSEEEQKQDAINVIIGLIEQYDLTRIDLEGCL